MSQQSTNESIGGCAIASILFFWATAYFVSFSSVVKELGAGVTIVTFFIIGYFGNKENNKKLEDARIIINDTVIENLTSLSLTINKCKDQYGNYNQTKYRNELKYFFDNVVSCKLSKDQIKLIGKTEHDRLVFLDEIISGQL